MVSLRFPFFFFPPNRPPKGPSSRPKPPPRRQFAASAAAFTCAAAAAAGGYAIAQKNKIQDNPIFLDALNSFLSKFTLRNRPFPSWGSLSLADEPSPVAESKVGASFPSILGGSRQLLGIGVRKKSVLGLKNIDVYAYGVYADGSDVHLALSEKYGKLSVSELKDNKEFSEDLMEGDICLTVRLQIVYSRLSIHSVRSAFEESVGSRLQKFGGADNKELLQRFTSQFKDEYKIPKGSVIDLSKERGHVLHTAIDGKEVGSIQSKLLCRSILDLYIGEDPFDRQAKAEIQLNSASLLKN